MILYQYEHCPYCVKARMIFGIKDIPVEIKTLLNDDEKTPIEMIGQKMLPILQKDNGEYLAESLDIIAYCDQLSDFGEPIVQPSRGDQTLSQWLSDVRKYHYALAMPRWVQMGLEEFATPSAIEYFTNKKVQSIGPFAANLALTPQLIAMAEEHLIILQDLLIGSPYFWGDQLSLDDFAVFATLRCLTTTRGLRFPPKIDAYMNQLSQRSKVPLQWESAIGIPES